MNSASAPAAEFKLTGRRAGEQHRSIKRSTIELQQLGVMGVGVVVMVLVLLLLLLLLLASIIIIITAASRCVKFSQPPGAAAMSHFYFLTPTFSSETSADRPIYSALLFRPPLPPRPTSSSTPCSKQSKAAALALESSA